MSDTTNPLGSFLTNDFGDRYLYAVNRNAFNRIGSDALYRTLFGENLLAEYQFNVIIGTDSGILIRYLIKSGVHATSRFIFIELPEVLSALKETGLLENLPAEISVTTSDSWLQQAEAYQLSHFVFLDGVRLHESLASTDANLPEYRNTSWAINQELTTAMHRIQTSSNSAPFILKQLENLPENRVAFSTVLHNALAARTAIILAGGPSLNAAIPWVKENRDRLVIIAVSRISRILLAEGIVPHLVASVDPQDLSFEVSREMLYFAEATASPIFVSSFHVSPQLLSQWGGKSAYTGPLFPWETDLNIPSLPFSGPTVSNYALSMAVNLGCPTVILAGVNFCYSAEGHTHAAGSNENKFGPSVGGVAPRLETYGGNQAETNQGYLEAFEVMELQAQWALSLGTRVYNCSPDAARIDHVEYKPLSDFELPFADSTTAEVLSACIPEATSQERTAHYRAVSTELDRTRTKLQEILGLCKDALGHCDGLFGRKGKKRDFSHKIRMDKIERRLDQRYGSYTILVKQFGLKRFLAGLKSASRPEEMTDEQVETATRQYYETYLEGTEKLIELLENTMERVTSRQEEEKNSPDFTLLARQWEKDHQFGRFHIWRRRHPDRAAALSPAEQERAREIETAFTRAMTEEQTSQVMILEKAHDVRNTRSKALLLLKGRDRSGLEALALGLRKHPDQEKALPYLHFVEGILSELRDDPQGAVSNYESLITDPPHELTEDALLQIATLATACNDVETSLLALECLAGISLTYLPPYGDLLKAVGRFEEAFNAYNRYIAFAPDDVAALLTFGLLCKEAGLKEPARELFERVIEKDPDNSAAKTLLGA